MAVPIEETNIQQTNFVTPTSRYANSTVIRWSDEKILTFKILKRKPYKPSLNDKFTTLGGKYEYRPDLLSRDVYGIADFWWNIMHANAIFDIFDFKAGLNIRLPSQVAFANVLNQ